MKRIVSILLSLCMALIIVACGSNGTKSNNSIRDSYTLREWYKDGPSVKVEIYTSYPIQKNDIPGIILIDNGKKHVCQVIKRHDGSADGALLTKGNADGEFIYSPFNNEKRLTMGDVSQMTDDELLAFCNERKGFAACSDGGEYISVTVDAELADEFHVSTDNSGNITEKECFTVSQKTYYYDLNGSVYDPSTYSFTREHYLQDPYEGAINGAKINGIAEPQTIYDSTYYGFRFNNPFGDFCYVYRLEKPVEFKLDQRSDEGIVTDDSEVWGDEVDYSTGYGNANTLDGEMEYNPEEWTYLADVGMYKMVSVIEDGTETSTEDLAALGLECSIEIKQDGTGIMTIFGEPIEFTWDDKGWYIGDEYTNYEYNGTTLVFGDEEATFVFERE